MTDFYRTLNAQLASLAEGSPTVTSALANAAALLYASLPQINWAGFYLTNAAGDTLLLGPFGGQPACLAIPFGKGVCGACAQSRAVLVVPDVHAFPGHIACDAASRSEIVLPLLAGETLVGVLDIDSPIAGRFGPEDAEGLGEFARILQKMPNWRGYHIL